MPGDRFAGDGEGGHRAAGSGLTGPDFNKDAFS